MKKIIVTGASGFIGRACVKQLLDQGDFEIHAVSRKKSKNIFKNLFWYQIDLFDTKQIQDFCREVKADYLLHLAWDVSEKNYNSTHHYDWVAVSVNLVKSFVKQKGERVLISGTCDEYDWNCKNCSEKSPIEPRNIYGIAKNRLRQLLEPYTKQHKVSFVWGRIFFAYGPYENPKNIIPYIIRNLKNNLDVEIMKKGDVRDYIYVDDVASALGALIESDIQGVVNISSDRPLKIKELVLKIANHFNKAHLVNFADTASNSEIYVVGENSRLQKELDWKPKVNIDEGLKRTIQFFEA